MAARAAERHWVDDPAMIEKVASEALKLARSSGDPATTTEVLLACCAALAGPDYTRRRVEMAGEALELSRQLRSIEMEATI